MTKLLNIILNFLKMFVRVLALTLIAYGLILCVTILVMTTIGVINGSCPFWYIPLWILALSCVSCIAVFVWAFLCAN